MPEAFTITVSQAALSRALGQSPLLAQALQPVAAAATRASRELAGARTKRHTGQLEGSYESRVIPIPGGGPVIAKVRTENRVPHALWMEAGTRPHRIPKQGETTLAFRIAGKLIVIHGHVQHPGTKPRWIIRDALRLIASRRHV